MSGVHTESAFEFFIEQYLLGDGWVAPEASSYSVTLGLDQSELITFIQTSQPDEWEQLTVRLGGAEAAADRVAAQVARQLDSRGTIDVLRTGVKMNGVHFRTAFFAPANGLVPELWERYGANRLGVVRQVHHSESHPEQSLDLMLLVNGLPVATAELKNPLTGQTVRHAMRQYRTNRTPSDLIFRSRAVVHFAVDPHEVWMTTRLAGKNTVFLPFNQGSGGPGRRGGKGNPASDTGYDTAYLWEQVWARDAWLDLLGSFVHVEDSRDADGQRTGRRTIFPRFHQWHAVRSLIDATVDAGPGTNRLVEHSAGSGKSNTIAWTAHHLSRLHTPHDPGALSDGLRAAGLAADQPIFSKVVIITDRRVLDRQLQQTVAGFDHTPGTIVTVDKDSKQLEAALAGNAARIIVTTLQKFPVVVKYAAKAAAAGDDAAGVAGAQFAVVIDEAHSSTAGDAMKDLKAVLGGNVVIPDTRGDTAETGDDDADGPGGDAADAAPADAAAADAMDVVEASMAARGASDRLSLFAFTATPKPKTLELFGEPATGDDGTATREPFHLYSMRQAIEEHFILDVLGHYTTYATYYRLANADGDPERTVPKGKASAALARFVSLHPTNVAQKAQIIVEHFRTYTASKIGGRAKAMVVTRSRLHAVRYYQAITRYIEDRGYDTGPQAVAALVAFSGSVTDPEAPSVVWTEAGMNGLAESKLPGRFASDDYQVLVVAEKYQTGFDEPLLHTMYVDKKLAGVRAVQTLSRLNRKHPDKGDTFVLDFANTAEAFRDALAGFVRAYAFLAQVMPWSDRDLESLYLYGKALLELLPRRAGEPVPDLADAVTLTHLRTEATELEADLSLAEGTDEPAAALPGGGQGRANDEPVDSLAALIDAMNERFGMELGDADRVLVDQGEAAIKEDEKMRVVALNNDEDSYRIVLDKFIEDLLLDRHEANGELFSAFITNPTLRKMLVDHYARQTYHHFREAGAS